MITRDYRCVGHCGEAWDRDWPQGCPICRGPIVPERFAKQFAEEASAQVHPNHTGTELHTACMILLIAFLAMTGLNVFLGYLLTQGGCW